MHVHGRDHAQGDYARRHSLHVHSRVHGHGHGRARRVDASDRAQSGDHDHARTSRRADGYERAVYHARDRGHGRARCSARRAHDRASVHGVAIGHERAGANASVDVRRVKPQHAANASVHANDHARGRGRDRARGNVSASGQGRARAHVNGHGGDVHDCDPMGGRA